jgi:hypothetical protein
VNELVARQQIEDCLRYYCRGIDRLDGDAVLRCFHPGGQLVDYGAEPMAVEAFVTYALPSLATKYVATQHQISNTLVEFDGGDVGSGGATVETYVMAFHVESTGSGSEAPYRLHVFNGRWIDRYTSATDGQWRCSTRVLRNDWSSVTEITDDMGNRWPKSGRNGTPDPLDGA